MRELFTTAFTGAIRTKSNAKTKGIIGFGESDTFAFSLSNVDRLGVLYLLLLLFSEFHIPEWFVQDAAVLLLGDPFMLLGEQESLDLLARLQVRVELKREREKLPALFCSFFNLLINKVA